MIHVNATSLIRLHDTQRIFIVRRMLQDDRKTSSRRSVRNASKRELHHENVEATIVLEWSAFKVYEWRGWNLSRARIWQNDQVCGVLRIERNAIAIADVSAIYHKIVAIALGRGSRFNFLHVNVTFSFFDFLRRAPSYLSNCHPNLCFACRSGKRVFFAAYAFEAATYSYE